MPTLASCGSGGAWFLAGPDGTKAAVFKPEDEEPGAAHNPRGWVGGAASPAAQEGLRRGSLAGEGAARELAAYVLDHGGFANVPATAMVTCRPTECGRWAQVEGPGDGAARAGAKKGSLQTFVAHDADCEEMGECAS